MSPTATWDLAPDISLVHEQLMVTRVAQAFSLGRTLSPGRMSVCLPVRPKAWCGHSTPTPQDARSLALGPAQTSILPAWPQEGGVITQPLGHRKVNHRAQEEPGTPTLPRHSLFRHMSTPAQTGLVGPNVQWHQSEGHCSITGGPCLGLWCSEGRCGLWLPTEPDSPATPALGWHGIPVHAQVSLVPKPPRGGREASSERSPMYRRTCWAVITNLPVHRWGLPPHHAQGIQES